MRGILSYALLLLCAGAFVGAAPPAGAAGTGAAVTAQAQEYEGIISQVDYKRGIVVIDDGEFAINPNSSAVSASLRKGMVVRFSATVQNGQARITRIRPAPRR